jgi:hypothetical protein
MTQSEAYLLTIDKALEAIFSSDDVPMSLMEQVINEMPTCLWEEMLDAFGFEFSQNDSGEHFILHNRDRVGPRFDSYQDALGEALEHLQDTANTIDVLEWLEKRLAETKAKTRQAFNSMTGNPMSALNNLSIRKAA